MLRKILHPVLAMTVLLTLPVGCLLPKDTTLPVLDMEQIKSINKAAPPETNPSPQPTTTAPKQLSPAERLILEGLKKFQIGQVDAAIADYTEAIKIEPTSFLAYGNRGNTYMAKGEVNLALADYSKAIEINDKYVEAYLDRGMTYIQTERNEEGIKDLEKGLSINPNFPSHFGNLSWAYIMVKQFDKAISSAQKGLEKEPQALWMKGNLGHAYLFSNQYDKALATYKEGFGTVLSEKKKRFEDGVLEDFKYFRTKGLDHPDMLKIEAEIAKSLSK